MTENSVKDVPPDGFFGFQILQNSFPSLKVIHVLQAFSNVILIAYTCTTVDKISTEIARRAVPL